MPYGHAGAINTGTEEVVCPGRYIWKTRCVDNDGTVPLPVAIAFLGVSFESL